MLSVNLLPLLVINKRMMKRMAGAITIISLGGIAAVFWNTPLYASTPVNANQISRIMEVAALYFTALINKTKVKATVSKKMIVIYDGRSVSIKLG